MQSVCFKNFTNSRAQKKKRKARKSRLTKIPTGLLVLPYVFGAEIWPNQIRNFGSALTQFLHWFFAFGVSKGMPSILTNMDNWGAFIFFAGWCFVALLFTFFTVPEMAGHSVEQLDALFEGPWWQIYKKTRAWDGGVIDSEDSK